jgi:hypothetical protein
VPYNGVKTATATVDLKIKEYANWLDGCRKLAVRFRDDLAFPTLARPYFCLTKPKALQFHGGKFARIGKWHVACYEQLKHGRDVPRPALRR